MAPAVGRLGPPMEQDDDITGALLQIMDLNLGQLGETALDHENLPFNSASPPALLPL
jgi:hypothetical protein